MVPLHKLQVIFKSHLFLLACNLLICYDHLRNRLTRPAQKRKKKTGDEK